MSSVFWNFCENKFNKYLGMLYENNINIETNKKAFFN